MTHTQNKDQLLKPIRRKKQSMYQGRKGRLRSSLGRKPAAWKKGRGARLSPEKSVKDLKHTTVHRIFHDVLPYTAPQGSR